MEKEKLIELIFNIFVILALIFALLGISINNLTNLFVWIFTSLIFSILSERIVESFTGDFLKNYGWTIEILGYEFSISLFLIVALILKIILF
ncbi:MAG TPA: hypothetical protein VMV95_01985 [Bacillota bacterium]|nr:hypothetical protein [Bacillota bacterium]